MKTRRLANIDGDLISNLPDCLLIQIVSLLPAADANRTRILSKRWNNIWPLLPNLHFITSKSWSTEELNMFHHSVDQTLVVRDGMPIQRLLFNCDYNFRSDTLYDCVRKVLLCKSHELELRFPTNKYHRVIFSLDLLKTCRTLVSLTLRGVMVFDIPDAELFFPCLKKMVLESVRYSYVKCFTNLISASPVLEQLVLENHRICEVDLTRDNTVMVSSSSLKSLSFAEFYSWCGYKVVIDAPKIEYLNIQDAMAGGCYLMTKPFSVTEAHIKIHRGANSVAELVTRISCFQILTLAASTMLGLIPCIHFIMLRHRREEVPYCLKYKLKEIIIKNQETITPHEFGLIRYLLKHSNKLETLTMNAHEIDEGRREQVLNFHRGSKSCRVEFV